jgi:hypothetical protein
MRVTATSIARSGSSDVTGLSLPIASVAPARSRLPTG